MKNQLDEGDFIPELVSWGAKSYGYVTKKGKTVCKIRGSSLNVRSAPQLNYKVMKHNILEEILQPLDKRRETLLVNSTHFVRDPAQKHIHTKKD